MVNKNVLSCLLKDGREVDAVTLVGRLFHARATVTRNDRSPKWYLGAEMSQIHSAALDMTVAYDRWTDIGLWACTA